MTFEALHLKARWLGCQRIELESCASTNDEAARLARAGAKHGTIVIAERQQSGRGRDGRTWESPFGGLYLSAVIRPPMPIVDVPPMTLAIGIGVCETVRSWFPAGSAGAALKWPNDVLVDGRKLAGVLVEAQSQGSRLEAVIVGIGVNLSGPLPGPVAADAVTLAEATGAAVDREQFIESLLAHVERWIDRYVSVGIAPIIPAWQERMALGLSARATVEGAPLLGAVVGLAPDGALLLRDPDGVVHRVRSGDVQVMRPLAAAAAIAR